MVVVVSMTCGVSLVDSLKGLPHGTIAKLWVQVQTGSPKKTKI